MLITQPNSTQNAVHTCRPLLYIISYIKCLTNGFQSSWFELKIPCQLYFFSRLHDDLALQDSVCSVWYGTSYINFRWPHIFKHHTWEKKLFLYLSKHSLTERYSELSLPKFTDSSKQVAVNFVRELDEYFALKKTPEKLRIPLVFRAISDPFAKQWMLTAYGKFKSYDEFKKAFTELLWDTTRQAEVRCKIYQERYDHRTRESFSEHYIRYATMASMLSPAMSDQDLLSALVTHYEPRIQACLISANVKTTQEAIAVLSKLHSLENLKETYRAPRRDYERKDQAWGHREATLLPIPENIGQTTTCKSTT